MSQPPPAPPPPPAGPQTLIARQAVVQLGNLRKPNAGTAPNAADLATQAVEQLGRLRKAPTKISIWTFDTAGHCVERETTKKAADLTPGVEHLQRDECERAKAVLVARELFQSKLPALIDNPELRKARRTMATIDDTYWSDREPFGKLRTTRDELFGGRSEVSAKSYSELLALMVESDRLLRERQNDPAAMGRLKNYQKRDYSKPRPENTKDPRPLVERLVEFKPLWDRYEQEKVAAQDVVDSFEKKWFEYTAKFTDEQALALQQQVTEVLADRLLTKPAKLRRVANIFMTYFGTNEALGYIKGADEEEQEQQQPTATAVGAAEIGVLRSKLDSILELLRQKPMMTENAVKVGIDMDALKAALDERDAELFRALMVRIQGILDNDKGELQQLRSEIVRDVASMMMRRGGSNLEAVAAGIDSLRNERDLVSSTATVKLENLIEASRGTELRRVVDELRSATGVPDLVMDRIAQNIENMKHSNEPAFGRMLAEIKSLLNVREDAAGIAAIVDATIMPRMAKMSRCLATGQVLDESGNCVSLALSSGLLLPLKAPVAKFANLPVVSKIRCRKMIGKKRCKDYVGAHGNKERQLCYHHV